MHVGQLQQGIPGGIGRVTQMLCDELPHHAEIVAFGTGDLRERRALESRLDPAVEVRTFGVAPARWQYEWWHRYRRPRIDMGVDVCHAPSLAVPPSAAPLVVSINDVAFLRHPDAFTRHGVRFHKAGLAVARREAAAVIVPSRFTRDELVREGFDPGRIHHVPLAVRSPEPASVRLSRDRLGRLGVSSPYLLAVGTIEPRKDHASIVAALERLRTRRPELSLVVAGASGWLPAKTAPPLAWPGVVACGPVSDAELDALYRHAEVVVNASVYEGFGLTVLEALTRGCAVVASRIPAHVELVGDGARLFPPVDVSALAAETEGLLRHPNTRAELAHAALRRSGRFTISAMIAGHLATYAAVHRL